MPEMNGRDLAENIVTLYPDIKLLFMSGYTANVIAHHGVLDEGVQFIQKPVSRKELARKIRLTLEIDAGIKSFSSSMVNMIKEEVFMRGMSPCFFDKGG